MLTSAFLDVMHPPHAGGLPYPTPVLIVGGSAAAGWVDRGGLGYVARGVIGYGAQAGFDFQVTNRAIPGAPVVDGTVKQHLGQWVRRLGPGGVVVLAWGLLNDMRLGTRPARIRQALARQIRTALRASDVVVVVTPPVTRPPLVQALRRESRLVILEIATAQSLHWPRVYVANVFRKQRRYPRAHHLADKPLLHGLWDPDTKGHRLAGRLLMRTFRHILKSDVLAATLASLRDSSPR